MAIADPIRRSILEVLAGKACTAGEIAALFPVSRPAISRHLRVLREGGLVMDRLDGRNRIYRLRSEGLDELIGWLVGIGTATTIGHRLDALATEVKRASRDRRLESTEEEASA